MRPAELVSSVKAKPFNWFLLLVIMIFTVSLVSENRQYESLRREKERLEKMFGRFDIDNPQELNLKLAERVSRDHLLWRVYWPARNDWRIAHRNAWGGHGWSSFYSRDATENILRFRVHRSDDTTEIHLIREAGPSDRMIIDEQAAMILNTHWDELQISFAGNDCQVAQSVDTILTLFEVRVPDDLMPKLKSEVDSRLWGNLQTEPLISFWIGTAQAFEVKESREQLKRQGGSE
ncbi:hypothetical protein CA13_72430 [Planctomycetes bacterium CA13]|uniref:Uncharacterized protein n=1 Tax=Novipirellula herctigrandis TaxID=2527986 RepID=A0A5C5YPC2_9BACT|nr:hypothetical protein CA13_72430 [Planctomycetes bacterium CA13]